MRRTLCTLMAAGSLLLSLVPEGSFASPPVKDGGSISITGQRTAYMDVKFDEKFTLDEEATSIDSDGTFAGWMMHRLGQDFDISKGNVAGAYVISDIVPPDEVEESFLFNVGFKSKNLAPGTYRVYLLADAPTRIEIPIAKGASSMKLRPTHRTDAIATTVDLAVTAGSVNDTKYTPVEVTNNTMTVSHLFFSAGQGITVQDVQACVKQEMDPVEGCEEGGIAGYVIHPLQTYLFALSSYYEPGVLAPGDHYAFQRAIAGVVLERVVGASLSVELKGA